MHTAHHHQRHSSSFFSSLGSMFNNRSPLPPANALPTAQTSERVHNYDGFEANLAQRLSLLLPPEGTAFLGLPSSRQVMVVLLTTVSDLRALLPELKFALSPNQHKVITDFLDRSVNLLDACNAIREAILQVQRWEKLLEVVLQSIGGKQGHLIEAQLRRSRKVLGNLKCAMDIEKEIEPVQLQLHHRSFRWSSRHSGESHEPQRSSSWHGNFSSSSNTARPLGMNLAAPKYTETDMEDCFTASLYALHVISVFFLSTIMAALPCQCKSLTVSITHPRHFLWALPLLNLQDRALEEMRKRGKGIASGLFWELYQISLHVRQLFEFIDETLDINAFPLSTESQEEMRRIVKQLSNHVEELETDLGPLDEQVTDIFHCLIKARIELLDLLRYLKA